LDQGQRSILGSALFEKAETKMCRLTAQQVGDKSFVTPASLTIGVIASPAAIIVWKDALPKQYVINPVL
jgi:hypothetical protein